MRFPDVFLDHTGDWRSTGMRVVDALFLRVAHCVIGVPACERRAT